MTKDNRILIALIFNAILILLVNECNQFLSQYQIYITVDSLFVMLPALFFRLYSGFSVAFLTGLIAYAGLPAAENGFLVICTAFTLAISSRTRMRRENPAHVILLTFLINGFIILSISILEAKEAIGSGIYWKSIFANLAISQFIILIIANKYINMQRFVMNRQGIDLAAELQTL